MSRIVKRAVGMLRPSPATDGNQPHHTMRDRADVRSTLVQYVFTLCDWLKLAKRSKHPRQRRGALMPEQDLELLKSLALRPTRTIAQNLQPIVSALHSAGYVTLGPDGWIATAAGCSMLEENRLLPNRQGTAR
jgi:hypothetical protein